MSYDIARSLNVNKKVSSLQKTRKLKPVQESYAHVQQQKSKHCKSL